MKSNINPAVNVFLEVWKDLELEGEVDSAGSAQYRRLLRGWLKTDRSQPPRVWIRLALLTEQFGR